MTTTATSKNGIAIRLTTERWSHIIEEHAELVGLRSDVMSAIGDPVRIVAGGEGKCWRYANWNWANFWLSCIVN